MKLYRITRYCCIGGCCLDCAKRGNHGDPAKRKRYVHASNVSRAFAEHCVMSWQRFDARMEQMGVRHVDV